MSLRDFYKCQYELEITRKTDLTTALSIPLGVVSLLIGALVLMAKDLHVPLSSLEWVTLACICSAAVGCSAVGFYLFKAHTAYSYAYLPTPVQVEQYYEGLLTFYKASGHDDRSAADIAEQDTLAHIDNEHASNASKNAHNNDQKSGQQFRANQALMIAVVLASVAGVFYVINSVSSPLPPQRVEVINPKELSRNGISTPPQPAASSASASSAADPTAKPSGQGRLPASIAPAPEVKPASDVALTIKP